MEVAPGGMDNDDRVQADVARELDASLLEKEANIRRLLEDALHRAEKGDDSRCARCRQPIGRARLRAVPFTGLCRACKDREEEKARSAMAPRSILTTS